MDSLANIFKCAPTQSPVIKGVRSAMLIEDVNTFLRDTWGAEAEKYAKAMYVKNKVLTIACLSSVMAQEIRMKEKSLLEKINGENGEKVVTKIQYLS